MITTPIKERAQALRTHERPEHTVDTDLPQELAKLAAQGGVDDLNPPPRGSVPVPYGACHKTAACQKRTAAVPEAGRQQVGSSTGLVDEGHPTILAPTRH